MKSGITLLAFQLTLMASVIFVDVVLSTPSRRDRSQQRTVSPSSAAYDHDVIVTSSPPTPGDGRWRKNRKHATSLHQSDRRHGNRTRLLRLQSSDEKLSCADQCGVQLCPAVCQSAVVVSDPCRCCACHSPDVVTTTTVAVARPPAGNACDHLTCSRNKVCLLNIQGLPMCRCPSVYHCKNVARRPVCTEGNRTFNNKCLVRVEECSTNRRLHVINRGACHRSRRATSHGRSTRRHHNVAT